jgi:negative regulator of replication initiation
MDDKTREEIVEQAQRERALEVAAQEAAARRLAEAEAVNASILANQAQAAARETAFTNRLLKSSLRAQQERSVVSYLILTLVLAVLIVGGFWLYGRMDRGRTTVYAGPTSGGSVVVTQPGTGR